MTASSAGSATDARKAIIIVPSVTRYDAISTSVQDTYRALSALPGMQVKVLSWRCDLPDMAWKSAGDLSDLLLDDDFLDADLIVYHFGIHVNLFDAMLIGNGHGKQVVCFHNVTPARFLPEKSHGLIEKSLRQIENFRRADEIWPVSQINARDLLDRGFDPEHIHIVPLAVNTPQLSMMAEKTGTAPVQLLFIGRVVPSKGVLDLVEALRMVAGSSDTPFHLRIIGNQEWSDPDYMKAVEAEIQSSGLSERIEFIGTASDEELERACAASDILAIPSYHEGFCKPVIEGLRTGMVPVGYDSYNLPFIANGFGRMSPAGDKAGLANALREIIEAIPAAHQDMSAPLLPLDRGPTSLAQFDELSKAYVADFSNARFDALVQARVQALLGTIS